MKKTESEIQIIKKIEKEFIKEDKAEPFINREYVEETKRIFGLLKESVGDFDNDTNRAIYDIVQDIFRYYRRKK